VTVRPSESEPSPPAAGPSGWGPGPLQILSLDGGGLKGLFSAAVLAEIESDLGVRIADHVDLIVGTSTGGLIALALGAGLRPADIVDFYVERSSEIFPAGLGRGARQLFRSKYSVEPLRAALAEVLGGRLLGESEKRLVIPAYSLDENDVYLFKTPHHPRLRRDGRETMVDVALATTAAPTFLPAFRLRHHRLIDGGVWANNPVLVGVAEAISMLGASPGAIRVLSLGTTDEVTTSGHRLDAGGVLRWARPVPALLLRAQALGSLHAAQHLLRPERITRIDPSVPDGLFRLDRLDSTMIRGLAEGVSRRWSPTVASFTTHAARPFTPGDPDY
jgi:patatin-like phospholipase/acyl hydrolase